MKRFVITLVAVLGLAGGLVVGLGLDSAEAQKPWTTYGMGYACDGPSTNCAPCIGNACD